MIRKILAVGALLFGATITMLPSQVQAQELPPIEVQETLSVSDTAFEFEPLDDVIAEPIPSFEEPASAAELNGTVAASYQDADYQRELVNAPTSDDYAVGGITVEVKKPYGFTRNSQRLASVNGDGVVATNDNRFGFDISVQDQYELSKKPPAPTAFDGSMEAEKPDDTLATATASARGLRRDIALGENVVFTPWVDASAIIRDGDIGMNAGGMLTVTLGSQYQDIDTATPLTGYVSMAPQALQWKLQSNQATHDLQQEVANAN